eukprot:4511155-Pyramimonas_sp.AAC.1
MSDDVLERRSAMNEELDQPDGNDDCRLSYGMPRLPLFPRQRRTATVSYTHLTLPTILLV